MPLTLLYWMYIDNFPNKKPRVFQIFVNVYLLTLVYCVEYPKVSRPYLTSTWAPNPCAGAIWTWYLGGTSRDIHWATLQPVVWIEKYFEMCPTQSESLSWLLISGNWQLLNDTDGRIRAKNRLKLGPSLKSRRLPGWAQYHSRLQGSPKFCPSESKWIQQGCCLATSTKAEVTK